MKIKEASIPIPGVIKKNVSQQNDNSQKVIMIKTVILSLISFFITKINLFGVMSPFGISLSMALSLPIAIPTYIGSMLGYGFLNLSQNSIIHMCILSFCMIVKIMSRRLAISKSSGFILLSTLICSLTINVVAKIVFEFSTVDLILRICESFLSAGGAVFFLFSCQGFLKNTALKYYSTIQLQSLSILAIITIGAFSSVELFSVNAGLFMGVILLNALIFNMGVQAGAIGGILLAISINLNEIDSIYIGGIIIIASLIASVFTPVGKICQASVFASVSLFTGFLVGINLQVLFSLTTILMATGIFLFVPSKWLAFLNLKAPKSLEPQEIKQGLENRILFAAAGMKDLQHSLEYVSKKLNKTPKDRVSDIFSNAQNQVCSSCSLNTFCYVDNKDTVSQNFNYAMKILKSEGELTKEKFNENIKISCCKSNTIVSYINKEYKDYLLKESIRVKTTQARSLAIEQLSGVHEMLNEVSLDLQNVENYDEHSTKVAKEFFSELSSSYPQCVFSSTNKYNRLEIQIYTSSFIEYDEKELIESLSNALERDFALPCISQIGDTVKISIFEKPKLKIDFAISQAKKHGEKICGDSFEYFIDQKGDTYMVLSDGMGSGANAAIDSTMTCGIISKLIYAGLGIDSIVKFVNTSLQVKSTEESTATIDLVKIDMFNGETIFHKAGSAPSFIVAGEKILKLETTSLPIGILNGAEFDKKSITLEKGNIIIMLSDGAKINDTELLQDSISKYIKKSAKDLSDDILNRVELNGLNDDDISVMVAKIS